MDTNKIEKFLLERELKEISKQLGDIGGKIKAVFDKYGPIKGEHEEELHDYIVKHVTAAGTNYYAGYTTVQRTNTNTDHIPECIKKNVLEWAVKDFFDDLENMREIVDCLEE